MGRLIQPFLKGLHFRLITPVVIIVLLLGAGLHVFVLQAVSEFADRQIKTALSDLTRQVYDICDRQFTALMKEGLVEAPRAVRIRKAQTVGAIEDFMQRQHLQGLLIDGPSGNRFIDSTPPVLRDRLQRLPPGQEAAFLTIDDVGYYLRQVTFQPWRWRFILVRDTGSYAPLIERVRRTYALTIGLLVLVVAALLVAMNRAVRIPLNQIIAAIQQGKAPDYKGTTEFEFLSGNIQEMMLRLEENTEWLSRLYRMAVSHRGAAFFDQVAETVASGFGGSAFIARFDAQRTRVEIAAMHIDGQRREPEPFHLAGTPCERILQEAVPVIISEGAARRFPEGRYLAAVQAEGYIGYPIFDREAQVVGALQAFGPARRFSRWDENLFRTISQMIASEFALQEREKAENQWRAHVFRTQKLESLGVLAGGIAHDFNNMLTAIMGNISLAKLVGDSGAQAVKRLEAAENAALRAQELTRQLLTFARGGMPVKTAVKRLDELIRETAEFSLRGSSVGCAFDFAPGLWPVEIDAGQFSQVIQNLVVNAQEAMPAGGRIRIRADNQTIDARVQLPVAPGRYVHVRVADSGIGIATEHLEKIFDPYFTTKKRGSGLGLAVSFSIIKQHDGHFTVESRIGLGTTFDIYIPATDKVVQNAPVALNRQHQGDGRILVMDDEEVVREWLGDALRQMGYTPEFAETGEQAIAAHAAAVDQQKPFKALIMDLTIAGGMGGKQALAQIRQREPAVVAIVASGYSNDPVMADFSRFGFSAALPKPFGLAALANVLQRLFEDGPAAGHEPGCRKPTGP